MPIHFLKDGGNPFPGDDPFGGRDPFNAAPGRARTFLWSQRAVATAVNTGAVVGVTKLFAMCAPMVTAPSVTLSLPLITVTMPWLTVGLAAAMGGIMFLRFMNQHHQMNFGGEVRGWILAKHMHFQMDMTPRHALWEGVKEGVLSSSTLAPAMYFLNRFRNFHHMSGLSKRDINRLGM